MRDFSINDLPNLDESVMSALEFFEKNPPPKLVLPPFKRPLVVGSGNAIATGKILFARADAAYATESTVEEVLGRVKVDGAVLISASGGKSSIAIARLLKERGVSTMLFTNTKDSLAAEFVKDVSVFPKVREPYTYNISTYLGMILGALGESPKAIREHIEQTIAPRLPDLAHFDALFFVVPPRINRMREMLITKCDELFGPRVSARAYNPEQVWHSKTIVPSDTELFVHLGADLGEFGEKNKLVIPLSGRYGEAMAASYFVVGKVQAAHPPYFKEHLAEYVKRASAHYGHVIPPIVE
jgi:hypothetical protein